MSLNSKTTSWVFGFVVGAGLVVLGTAFLLALVGL